MGKLTYVTGFDSSTLWTSLKGIPRFVSDWVRYGSINQRPEFRPRLKDAFPILTDRWARAGVAGGHYFHQDNVGREEDFSKPSQKTHRHRVAFRWIRFACSGFYASHGVESLSSFHVAEHFGLGRYSDPIDPEACFKFMDSLQRVLAPGGRLYFSVPVGRERVEFNAHRVFDIRTVLKRFSALHLVSFSFVGDEGSLHQDVDPATLPNSDMACGLFEFSKI